MRAWVFVLGVPVCGVAWAGLVTAAPESRSNSYIAAEFPRIVSAGFELKRGRLGGGVSAGGASFGRDLGNGPGESLAVEGQFYPDPAEDFYYGLSLGWQRVSDSLAVRSVPRHSPEDGTYDLVDQPQETAYFAVPHLGYRYISQERFFVGGEVGWHQPFGAKRDMRSRVQSKGEAAPALTEEQRSNIADMSDHELKTKGTLYLMLIKAGIVF